MDLFDYACPTCGQAGKASGALLGRELTCEGCGKGFFASGVVTPREATWASAQVLALVGVALTCGFAGAALGSVLASTDAEAAMRYQKHQDEKIVALELALSKAEAALSECTCEAKGN